MAMVLGRSRGPLRVGWPAGGGLGCSSQPRPSVVVRGWPNWWARAMRRGAQQREKSTEQQSSKPRSSSRNGSQKASSRQQQQQSSKLQQQASAGRGRRRDTWGKLQYNYYNWRQDTSSDLLLVLLAFCCLIMANTLIRSLVVNNGLPQGLLDFWQDFYEVVVLSFGQEFPEDTASVAHQAFSLGVAGLGLMSFALVLALVEQLVLETLEQNVRQGSPVYEEGHVLVLGWCFSQRDLEVVWKALEQLCYAHRNDGGVTVVVLTQRMKLDMESYFRSAIPPERRYGSRFVFRQGSPLVVRDLDMVAAQHARTVLVISDQSRCPDEADAQSLRASILLSELITGQAATNKKEKEKLEQVSWMSIFSVDKDNKAAKAAGNGSRNGAPAEGPASNGKGSGSSRAPEAAAAVAVGVVAPVVQGATTAAAVVVQGTVGAPVGQTASVAAGQMVGRVEEAAEKMAEGVEEAARKVEKASTHPEDVVQKLADGWQQLLEAITESWEDIDEQAATSSKDEQQQQKAQGEAAAAAAAAASNGDGGKEGKASKGVKRQLRCARVLPPICSLRLPEPGMLNPLASAISSGGPQVKAKAAKGSSKSTTLKAQVPSTTRRASAFGIVAYTSDEITIRYPRQPEPEEEPLEVEVVEEEEEDPEDSIDAELLKCLGLGEDALPVFRSISSVDTEDYKPAAAYAARNSNGATPHLHHSNGTGHSHNGVGYSNGHGPAAGSGVPASGYVMGYHSNGAASSNGVHAHAASNGIGNGRAGHTPASSNGHHANGTHSNGNGHGPGGNNIVTLPGGPKASSNGAHHHSSNGVHHANGNGASSTAVACHDHTQSGSLTSSVLVKAAAAQATQEQQDSSSTAPRPAVWKQVRQWVGEKVRSTLRSNSSSSSGEEEAQSQDTANSSNSNGGSSSPASVGPNYPEHVIVELKTADAIPLLRFSTNDRFIPVSTAQLNARRLAKMVREPIVANITQEILDFKNPTNMFTHNFPELAGETFGNIAYRFDDAVVLGVCKADSKTVRLNPSPAYKVKHDDTLLMLRPTGVSKADFRPLRGKIVVSQDWEWMKKKTSEIISKERDKDQGEKEAQQAAAAEAMLKQQQKQKEEALKEEDPERKEALLRSTGVYPAAASPSMPMTSSDPFDTFFLYRPTDDEFQAASDAWGSLTKKVLKLGAPDVVKGILPKKWVDGSKRSSSSSKAVIEPLAMDSMSGGEEEGLQEDEEDEEAKGEVEAVEANSSSRSTGSYENALQCSAIFMVPIEYLKADDKARYVLVCGWGELSFMTALIRELDQGNLALPKGSKVDFVNSHCKDATLDAVMKEIKSLSNIEVAHITADPQRMADLASAGVHKKQYNCAIVLCDQRWYDPDQDSTNGFDILAKADMLRLDSMVMRVQLNIRKLIEDDERPSINIVCQKVAMEGLTRFEDRKRLPLGISINFTSYAAKVLTQSAFDPLFLEGYAQAGTKSDYKVIDAGELAYENERVSYWQLLSRAQALHQILLGWYMLPTNVNQPMEMVINPQGLELRSRKRLWNKGDNRLKFLVLQLKDEDKAGLAAKTMLEHKAYGKPLPVDDDQLSDTEQLMEAAANLENKKARWVEMGPEQEQQALDVGEETDDSAGSESYEEALQYEYDQNYQVPEPAEEPAPGGIKMPAFGPFAVLTNTLRGTLPAMPPPAPTPAPIARAAVQVLPTQPAVSVPPEPVIATPQVVVSAAAVDPKATAVPQPGAPPDEVQYVRTVVTSTRSSHAYGSDSE